MPLLETTEEIDALLPTLQTLAVLGIKTPESRAPAFYVAEYAQSTGRRIIPVPVYYPEVTAILGEPVFRRLADITEPVDAVVIFRRPADIPAHVDDILALAPRVVWMQLGIRHDEVAARLSAAGISVVQDRCLLVELQDRGL
jgi:predicted CoA-binding protein